MCPKRQRQVEDEGDEKPDEQRRCKELSVIVEVDADSYDELRTFASAAHQGNVKPILEESTFADGVEIMAATNPHVPKPTEICQVPHFGHDCACDDPCEGPGVFRLFEVAAVVKPSVTSDIFGRYRLESNLEVDICGLHKKTVPISSFREFVDEDTPCIGRFGREYGPNESTGTETDAPDKRRDRLGVGAAVEQNSTLSKFDAV